MEPSIRLATLFSRNLLLGLTRLLRLSCSAGSRSRTQTQAGGATPAPTQTECAPARHGPTLRGNTHRE